MKLQLGVALAFIAFCAGEGLAQTYPSKPIRLVNPFPAGGPVETLARVFTQRLTETMGQPFVIDNRPGASGTLGSDLVAKAPRDGYTMLVFSSGHTMNPSTQRSLPYDTVKDFAPITIAATLPLVVVVPAQSPIKTFQDLIATARAQPGKLTFQKQEALAA